MVKEPFKLKFSAMILADRAYGENCTEEEVAAIEARVNLYEKEIIVFNQMPVASAFSIKLLFEKVKICTRDMASFSMIVDVSHSATPNAKLRALIKRKYGELPKLKKVAVIAKKYSVLAVAARFISTGIGFKEYVVRDNFEQALQYVSDERP